MSPAHPSASPFEKPIVGDWYAQERAVHKCCGFGCSAAATLRCPTCDANHLLPSYYCSKACFQKAWPVHKIAHKHKNYPYSLSKDIRFDGFLFTGSLRPGSVSAMRSVPRSIPQPDYAETGESLSEIADDKTRRIRAYDADRDIAAMREAGQLGRQVLDMAGSMVAPGVTPEEIDAAVHDECIRLGVYPSTLNYHGFPKSCCTSVNEVICHGIPDRRPLCEGDIVNIDVTVFHEGFHSDLNETFAVGRIAQQAVDLMRNAHECMMIAIEKVRPGVLYRHLGAPIEQHAASRGYSVPKGICSHGVNEQFHPAPTIPHYARNKAVGVISPGHVFTIEPMVNAGTHREVMWPDEWTIATADGSLSAQFEHTMMATPDGVEIFTARTPDSVPFPWG